MFFVFFSFKFWRLFALNLWNVWFFEACHFPFKNTLIPIPTKTNISPESQWLEDEISFFEYVPFFGGDILILRGPTC